MSTLTYKGLETSTLRQIAEEIEMSKDNLLSNFNNDRKEFTYGRDYFKLIHDELKFFKKENPHKTYKGVSSLLVFTVEGRQKLTAMNMLQGRNDNKNNIKKDTEVIVKSPSIIPKRNQIVEISDSSVICYDPEEYTIIKTSDYEKLCRMEFAKEKLKNAISLLSSVSF